MTVASNQNFTEPDDSPRMRIFVIGDSHSKSNIPPGVDLALAEGRNLLSGSDEFRRHFADITSLEEDMLRVAASIFAADLASKRGERENVSRDIEISIPVVNSQAFNACRDTLHDILYTLAHDNWEVTFRRSDGQPESYRSWPSSDGKTLLFSGGLDSLAGAVDVLDEMGVLAVQFASHQTGNQTTRSAQRQLVEHLCKAYGADVPHIALRTGGRRHSEYSFPIDKDREGSQRTRSFMFLTIGSLAARRNGKNRLVLLAENGQMAIHLPLTVARVGAFSTHTAHPDFIDLASDFFTKLLDHPITIENPYVYRTKAEVVSTLVKRFGDAIPLSTSCWKNARTKSHCGECIPCYVRRVALEANNLHLVEYERDIFNEDVAALPPKDEGKRNLVDFFEFIRNFSNKSDAELTMLYPELYSSTFDSGKAIAMYRRFAAEATTVFSSYPTLCGMLTI